MAKKYQRHTTVVCGIRPADQLLRASAEEGHYISYGCPRQDGVACGDWCPAFVDDGEHVSLLCFPHEVRFKIRRDV